MYRTPSFGSVRDNRGSTSGSSSLKDIDNRNSGGSEYSSTSSYTSSSYIPKFDDHHSKMRAGQSTGKLERGGSVSRLRDNITMSSSSGLDRSASAASKSYIPLNQRAGYLRGASTGASRTTLRSTSSSSIEEPSTPTNGDVSFNANIEWLRIVLFNNINAS